MDVVSYNGVGVKTFVCIPDWLRCWCFFVRVQKCTVHSRVDNYEGLKCVGHTTNNTARLGCWSGGRERLYLVAFSVVVQSFLIVILFRPVPSGCLTSVATRYTRHRESNEK